MSLFSRFFKAKPPETLEQKLAALEHLSQDQLIERAQNSEIEAVRLAAIKKLSFSDALLKLAISQESASSIQVSARKRIGELLDANAISVETLSQKISDQSTLLALCGYSSQNGTALVEQINDPAILMDIATQGSTTQVRQAAANKLQDKNLLEQLAKQAMNKDKAVYKIVRAKLDVFKEEKARQAKLDAEAQAICAQMEQLSKRAVDDIFVIRKNQIEASWSHFSSHASPEVIAKFQSAQQKCQQKIDDLAEAEKQRQAAFLAEQEAKSELTRTLSAFQGFYTAAFAQTETAHLADELKTHIGHTQNAIEEAIQRGLNTRQEKQRFQELQDSASLLVEKVQQFGSLQTLLEKLNQADDNNGRKIKSAIDGILSATKALKEVEQPEVIHQAREMISEWTKKSKAHLVETKSRTKEFSELLRKGNWAVNQGHVGRARAILQELQNKTQQASLPNHIAQKMEDLKASIEKLGDWHEFAVTPKKEALVKSMQALENSTLHPKDLADKIHSLQDEWKTLSRGGQNQDEELWQAFHEAAQKAYEPCKHFFDEQNQVRELNAKQRRELISRLSEYLNAYDWEHANWKEVEKTLRISRDAWVSYWPIPRKDNKELQKSFDQLMDQLYEKLHREYERNKQRKAEIVTKAQQLLELPDTQEAIEGAKKLQAEWRSVGQCKRKDDQTLWQEFRTHCDAVFEKRQIETESLKEERQEAQKTAENIVAQLQAILKKNGDAFLNAQDQAEKLLQEFQGIGELPKESSKKIMSQLREISDALQQKALSEKNAASAKAWLISFNIASQINILENNALKNNGNADESAVSKLRAELSSEAFQGPDASRDILEQRLSRVDQLNTNIQAETNEKLRILCIRAEIMTGRDTPTADKALRMQLQVENLKQNFGHTVETDDQSMHELLAEWLGLPAADNTIYKGLETRFLQCWNL